MLLSSIGEEENMINKKNGVALFYIPFQNEWHFKYNFQFCGTGFRKKGTCGLD